VSLRARIRAEVNALEHRAAPTWVLFGVIALRFVLVGAWLLLRRAMGIGPGRAS
jgi:hypothetical protein